MTKRDIKLRAWHTPFHGRELGQKYVYGNQVISFNEMRPDKYELEQYTGLKDINGVEIYEGDILSPSLDSDLKFVIEFKQGAFIGISVDEDAVIRDASLRLLIVGKSSVIIGNVHQNPELLEV